MAMTKKTPKRMKRVKQDGEYGGVLSPLGSDLDSLYDYSLTKISTKKETVEEPSPCPSCGNVRILHRGFFATLCQECHDDITRRASMPYQ